MSCFIDWLFSIYYFMFFNTFPSTFHRLTLFSCLLNKEVTDSSQPRSPLVNVLAALSTPYRPQTAATSPPLRLWQSRREVRGGFFCDRVRGRFLKSFLLNGKEDMIRACGFRFLHMI